jgi:glycosyltransferase involved in cell wall biosynthesis
VVTGALSVFLPAWNEVDNIARVVHEVRAHLCTLPLSDFEVIVIDDGSTDGTADAVKELMAEDARVRVVSHPENRGYGAALRTGFASARFERVFFTDGDGQFAIGDIDRVLELGEQYDVVVGYRSDRQDPALRRFSGRAWSAVVNLLFRLHVRDVDCAFKLLRAADVDRIGPLRSSGAVLSTELLWKLQRAGCSSTQVAVRHRPRVAGQASGGSLRVIARAFAELLRLRFGR